MLLDRSRGRGGGAGHGVDELGWFGRRGWGHRFGRDRGRDLLSFHYRDGERERERKEYNSLGTQLVSML